MASNELTGGLNNYYLIRVDHPQRENQEPYTAECEDLIAAAQMDFNEACEFKAIWRTAMARLGNGKKDHKAKYDAEKRVHYAKRSLRELQIKEGSLKEEEFWYGHDGEGRPHVLNPESMVTVIFRHGGAKLTASAKTFTWFHNPVDPTNDIIKWRLEK